MITKRALTTRTPSTLILGIASNSERTAMTAAMVLKNGSIESDIVEFVGGDLWQSVTGCLDELRILRARHLLLLTTSNDLHGFLQPPLQVEQLQIKKVRLGREVLTVRVGGNEYQWKLLRQLFYYVWRCERIEKLSRAEELLHVSDQGAIQGA